MTVAIDTSVVIAALLSWHEDHDRAASWLSRHLRKLVLPQPVLVESYSVMTRLPSPHRIGPEDAYSLLESNLREVPLVGLPSSSAWTFVRTESHAGTAGGSVYDALVIECAVRAGAAAIGTLNARDFVRLAGDRIAVIDPT